MFTEYFWGEFWPQFFGGLASGIVLALLTVLIGHLARYKIVRWARRLLARLEKDEQNKL